MTDKEVIDCNDVVKNSVDEILKLVIQHEKALTAHSIMHDALDDDRNIQAGKVYELRKLLNEAVSDLSLLLDLTRQEIEL